ncbi:MAG: NAD-dependent dehydratase [Candidatus Andersenbacteria bacterium RIFCSPHIGHO2_12_FULL_45_11b]|uniref:NAD-dependent dehydratase n=1 Tax=Candidatus Andersenbacteria bacterium RIFCSPHIGHO2_12_FULL_45_11b TaxID=1797282 RepID=A0A1G1XDE1_9BACT|nr:MAG: NAD-dependent dehydratase [Candidatus Andersenbacteria bacterium RIFCSPHIGHO2_12_FULL_45_11b]
MKVLVTGGAGFIGSHLVDRLIADGHEVIALDNLAVGRRENIAHHEQNPRFSFIEADIRQREYIGQYFAGIDYVFHLAALADIVPSIVNPVGYYTTNVLGTMNVLECARAAQVKRFVYVASSSCYGIPEIYPTPETAAINPEYPYALTKYLGEETVLHWGKVYKMPVVSVRFFNIFGPRARTSGTYGAVFGVFLAQKIHNQPFTVVGDGTQTRDFTYVTDAVDALVTCANSGISQEIFNVGSGGTHSVNRLVELLGGDVIHIPKRPGEPDATFADITKIRTMLGWYPRVSFEEGVRNMLAHIDAWRNAPVWNEAAIHDATKDWFKYLG